MNVKKFSKVLSALAISTLLLSACSGGGATKTAEKVPEKKVDTSKFPMLVKNEKEGIKDGSLTYGLASNTPFSGILNEVVMSSGLDDEVTQLFDEPLLYSNDKYEFTNDGPASFKLSEDKKTITLTIKDKVKWQDGNPVTAEDLEYAYLVIGNAKYAGDRFDSQMENVVGMKDYHEGKADKISGVKVIDPKTISISFNDPNPSMLTGLWTWPLDKKYLGDVPIDKLAESDKIRKNPIGMGPFKVKKIVPGESVEFERFDDYWGSKAQLKSLILKVVNPSVVNASLKNGDIDMVEVTADQYDNVKALKNVQVLGKTGLYYSYLGFKLGHYDAAKKENVSDNPKFKDVRVRQAMAYAIDTKEIGDKLYKGLRFPANSPIPPSLPKFYNDKLESYTKDVEKAKKLLDDAGYKAGSDGLRTDPSGKPFSINLLVMSGSDVSEPFAKYLIQSWKDVGLNVQLVDGRLHEFNSFYDMVKKDDPKVDMFSAAWGTGSDPDPSGIWAPGATFNYMRWVNDKNTEYLKDGLSLKAMDDSYRKDVYAKWQQLVHDEVPMIPLNYKFELRAANNRVKNYDITPGSKLTWKDVTVTADKPE